MEPNSILQNYMATRRSVPALSMEEPGPDGKTLRSILTLGARVPDHGKLAPWRFVVIEGEARARLGAAFADIVARHNPALSQEQSHLELTRLTRAPVVIMVVSRAAPHPKIPEWEQVLSAGAACMTLLMAANAHGFAAQWLTEWMSYDEDACAVLGIRAGEKIAGFIHIGTPTQKPTDRDRPNLADIVSWAGPEG